MEKFSKSLSLIIITSFLFSLGTVSAFAATATNVDLGSVLTNNFVILAETAITDNTPTNISAITGNVGLSAAAGSNIAGLSCTEVAGKIYEVNNGYTGGYDSNTTCKMSNPPLVANKTLVDDAVTDMGTAYTAASNEVPGTGTFLDAGSPAGTLNGQTLVAGVYTWDGPGNVTITGDITLSGGANDIWVFQIPGTLDIQHNVKIILGGSAQAKNIFWRVAGVTTLITGSTFEGNILDHSDIAMQLGAKLDGRALSHTQVTLVGSIISTPVSVVTNNGGNHRAQPIVPIIDLVKVPSPLALSAPGPVTYTYTVKNIGGYQPLIDITLVDDKCSPIVLSSGDVNNNGALDIGEIWKYTCNATLNNTTTNTAIVTGHSSDGYYNTAIDTAIATVVVGTSVQGQSTPAQPPLINVVKVPNQLTPFPYGGGNIVYTYTVTNPGVVAMNNVTVTDDKCPIVSYVSGDTNSNGLLDTNETWIYTCKTTIQVSTGSVATAKGNANGFTALAYGFANVLVAAPELPNTGFPSSTGNTSWSTIVLSGIILVLAVSLIAVLRKNKKLV